MQTRFALIAGIALTGCSQWWSDVEDYDGDGYSIAAGDCNDGDVNFHPGMEEIWYDGIDQNCDGNDYDKDEDGHISAAYGGDDCWDDPDRTDLPEALTILPGEDPKKASEVNPSADETFYDGLDQDCGDDDDFDQDGDGYRSAYHEDRQGVFGEDCIDGSELDADNPAGLSPEEVNPEAEETWYDGTNADCDPSENEVWGDYDQDGDGHPSGIEGEWEDVEEDCDDQNASRFPDPSIAEVWYDCYDDNCDGNDGDQDGDGYVLEGYEALCSDWNSDAFFVHGELGDCWDSPLTPTEYRTLNGFEELTASDVNPGQTERFYDGVDADCDGSNDFDQDEDGHNTSQYPNEYNVYGSDCDDGNAQANPDQTEDCATAFDDDCSGTANEINAFNCQDFYSDQDGDGYGTSTSLCLCSPDGAFSASNSDDCDDQAASTNPGADEYCDGHDDDCDNEVDEDDAVDAPTWYADTDYDGFGDANQSSQSCTQVLGIVANSDDCNDSDKTINPDADEVCDGVDNDCDGASDENDAVDASVWYIDADSDGYGSSDSIAIECNQPTGYLLDSSDCDDSSAAVYPGATEVENEDDDNCDDRVDEGFRAFGDLYLTELSTRGSGTEPDGEWFELYNPSTADIYLDGVSVDSTCSTSAPGFVVGVDAVVVPAGGYAVFCHDDNTLATLCDYVYGENINGSSQAGNTYSESFCLDEGGDTLSLSLDGVLLDDVAFMSGVGGWRTHEANVSLVLHTNYYGANSNDTPTNWCYPGSSEVFGTVGRGNPGAGMVTCNGSMPNSN